MIHRLLRSIHLSAHTTITTIRLRDRVNRHFQLHAFMILTRTHHITINFNLRSLLRCFLHRCPRALPLLLLLLLLFLFLLLLFLHLLDRISLILHHSTELYYIFYDSAYARLIVRLIVRLSHRLRQSKINFSPISRLIQTHYRSIQCPSQNILTISLIDTVDRMTVSISFVEASIITIQTILKNRVNLVRITLLVNVNILHLLTHHQTHVLSSSSTPYAHHFQFDRSSCWIHR